MGGTAPEGPSMKPQDPATHRAAPAPLHSSDAATISVSQEVTSVMETTTVGMTATKTMRIVST